MFGKVIRDALVIEQFPVWFDMKMGLSIQVWQYTLI